MPLASLADTMMTVMLVGVLALGYIALWAIWHFGFKGKGLEDRERDD